MFIKTTSILLLLSTLTFFNACSTDSLNKTPKCSDLAIIDTLAKILSTNNRKATINIDTVRKKIDLTEQSRMRTCRTKVDYIYSVDANTSFINQDMDKLKIDVLGTDGVSRNNKVFYTIVFSETRKKYTVNLVKQ